MKKEELRQMIRQELGEALKNLHLKPSEDHHNPHLDPHLSHENIEEKSVPEPYNRKGARKMSKGQIEKRDRIGKAMEKDEKTVSKFRKAHGQDWKSYLWAAASAAAFRQK
jgi:hypothetical protein